MGITWEKVTPGTIILGSNDRSVLFGGIGPRHENVIKYNYEISHFPIEKNKANELIDLEEYFLASEAEWELAKKQNRIFGDNEVEELGDKIRSSYWNKQCDGRIFIDDNWVMKVGREWKNGVSKPVYLGKDEDTQDFVRIVKKKKCDTNTHKVLPKNRDISRLLIEEIVISLVFGILPSFIWAYFNASGNYIIEGWLNLTFGGIFIGFFTIIFWRPKTKTYKINDFNI